MDEGKEAAPPDVDFAILGERIGAARASVPRFRVHDGLAHVTLETNDWLEVQTFVGSTQEH